MGVGDNAAASSPRSSAHGRRRCLPLPQISWLRCVCCSLEVGEGGVFNSYVKPNPVLPRNRYGLGNGGKVKKVRPPDFFPVQVRDTIGFFP